jgi:arylsulfatase A-like enzyme
MPTRPPNIRFVMADQLRWDYLLAPNDARGFMVRTARWKCIHFEGLSPQLFDLDADHIEQTDHGTAERHADVYAAMKDRLITWLTSRKPRTPVTHDFIERMTGDAKARGYWFGEW